MTHAHNRTLLSRLGFADPDRKEPRHDLATRYLIQTPQMDALVRTAIDATRRTHAYLFSDDKIVRWRTPIARREVALSKGQSSYKTTIGFIDLDLRSRIGWFDGDGERPHDEMDITISVEVKITRVSWSELLRQINLYREYHDPAHWVAALAYDVDEAYVEQLRSERVHVVRLGARFDEWAKTQSDSPRATLEEI